MELLHAEEIRYERDVVNARQRTRAVAEKLGFDRVEQVRLATAVSEMVRNAFRYASGGKVEFLVDLSDSPSLNIIVSDKGAGIPNLEDVLSGRYASSTGMGLGIVGTKRLMDFFDIDTGTAGTTVTIGKRLPTRAGALQPKDIALIRESLSALRTDDPVQELQRQNRELLAALSELRVKQEELAALNRELEDTNRGVVALYAELDERADFLRRASELKSTFLSNMSHEFRTPLNSILSLTQLLSEGDDGILSPEQAKQVEYISKSARVLYEMVNDLLDLAKVEAGKVELRPKAFTLTQMFSALRGMLRPLLMDNHSIQLVFEDASEIPDLYTDEAKLSQILRNFISNAIKFTRRGEVRISSEYCPKNQTVTIRVADTGIGIEQRNLELIFEEFSQIDSELQRSVQGTGLGLPLSRRFAELLKGRVDVTSQLGIGSIFSVTIPISLRVESERKDVVVAAEETDRIPVMMVEDNRETAFVYDSFLRNSEFGCDHAPSADAALKHMRSKPYGAYIVDVTLQEELRFDVISSIARTGAPVIAVSVYDYAKRAIENGATEFLRKPLDQSSLLSTLRRLLNRQLKRILLVDDQEAPRYALRTLLGKQYEIRESNSAEEALATARSWQPDVILLDLIMPGMSGTELIAELQRDPQLRGIPRIVNTSLLLRDKQITEMNRSCVAVLSKEHLTTHAGQERLKQALTKAMFGARAEGAG
jgi:signal transduction histidine kinase/CheY-like chemotaxis protein